MGGCAAGIGVSTLVAPSVLDASVTAEQVLSASTNHCCNVSCVQTVEANETGLVSQTPPQESPSLMEQTLPLPPWRRDADKTGSLPCVEQLRGPSGCEMSGALRSGTAHDAPSIGTEELHSFFCAAPQVDMTAVLVPKMIAAEVEYKGKRLHFTLSSSTSLGDVAQMYGRWMSAVLASIDSGPCQP